MTDFYHQSFFDLDISYSIIIEDDGSVAYAYLLKDEKIVGDVWLYNQGIAPAVVDWKNKDVPFLNPSVFLLSERTIAPIKKESDFNIKWTLENQKVQANIYIRGALIACLKPGDFPGFSTLVCKDGPLAKALLMP